MLLALNPPPDPAQAIPDDRFSESRIGLDHLSLSVASMADLNAAVALFDARGIAHGEIKPPVCSPYLAAGGAERQPGPGMLGTPIKTILGEDDVAWDVAVVADDVNDALAIIGYSNQSGDTIRFVATVRTTEVAW